MQILYRFRIIVNRMLHFAVISLCVCFEVDSKDFLHTLCLSTNNNCFWHRFLCAQSPLSWELIAREIDCTLWISPLFSDDNDSSHVPSSSPGLPNNNNTIKHDGQELKSDCASTTKPKIWSLADTAACKTPPPPPQNNPHHPHHHHPLSNPHHPLHHSHLQGYNNHHHHSNGGGSSSSSSGSHGHPHHPSAGMMNGGGPPPPPVPVSSSWSFPLPPAYRYGGFPMPPHMGSGNEGVGTDTPPQTPPNLKVPLLPGSLSHFTPGTSGSVAALNSSADLNSTAFKPVLKR